MRRRRTGSEPAALGVPGFDEWLRTELKVRKMSQRQLAHQSGVDHSTISRLVLGLRAPSLTTVTKLVQGLRGFGHRIDAPDAFDMVTATPSHATARVEYALRSDDMLSALQVARVMDYYLAVRACRLPHDAVRPTVRTVGPLPEAHNGRRRHPQ